MQAPIALVVDDEALIAHLIESVLVDAGFDVRVAHTADDAVALIDESDADLAALVTDVRLGSGSGWAVATHARERQPLIAVVYVTGDSAEAWPAHGVPQSVLIQKPFVGAQIVTAVTGLMNAPTTPASGPG